MLPLYFLLPCLAAALPASPAEPTQVPIGIDVLPPIITPAPTAPPKFNRRGLKSDIGSDISAVGSDVSSDVADLTSGLGSVLSALGSDVPGFVVSGVPNFFQNFPTGTDVLSSLSLTDSDLAAVPTQVLNIPYVQSIYPSHSGLWDFKKSTFS